MISLLDVNVLIALLDTDHQFAPRAMDWFRRHENGGWATCPLTLNGCARILGNPSYQDGPGSVSGALAMLQRACRQVSHQFWPDDLSPLDEDRIRHDELITPRQLTDTYLLALAVRRGGRLVTFDRSIRLRTVVGAETRHLVVL